MAHRPIVQKDEIRIRPTRVLRVPLMPDEEIALLPDCGASGPRAKVGTFSGRFI